MQLKTHPAITQLGAFANANGVLFVVYFGWVIAIIGADGSVIAMNHNYPMYLIEYLISLPTSDKVRLN